MKVGIVGAGLGGLLAGAYLSSEGFEVEIFEKLPFAGGRFTSFSYKGYEVSTGALHMIPHGKRGPLGRILKEIGCKVEIVDSKPEGEILWNGEREMLTRKSFTRLDVLKLNFEFIMNKLGRKRTLEEFARGLSDKSYLYVRSFLGWSFSIFPDQMRFEKIVPIFRRTELYGGPGIPVGGCKAVTESLAEIVESNGGRINLRREVRAIKSGEKPRLFFDKEEKKYDVIISDAGHKITSELLGEKHYDHPPESKGVKYTIAIDEPFIGHTGVLFVLGKNVAGMNEVTNADDSLGRKHMLQLHQPLRDGTKAEILHGLMEIKEILKGYSFEIIAIQSYKGDWPVNRVMAGMDMGNRTKYDSIYVVGDGAKGDDIEVDGIALGVEKVLEDLL